MGYGENIRTLSDHAEQVNIPKIMKRKRNRKEKNLRFLQSLFWLTEKESYLEVEIRLFVFGVAGSGNEKHQHS